MDEEVVGPIAEVIARLRPGLTPAGDQHSLYASAPLPSGDDSESLDVLVQTVGSQLPFGLWFGPEVPTSPEDDDFAPEATVERAANGSIVAWLEQVRDDEDGEPYEIVRILVAFRDDGCVVTVNRYSDAEVDQPAEPWQFASLRKLALAPEWCSLA